MTKWKKLILRYADGRPICNCGEAYYSPCGHGIDSSGKRRTDMLACRGGCSANLTAVMEDIATRVLAELGKNRE